MSHKLLYGDSGLANVWLVNGFTFTDDLNYGRFVSFNDIDGLHRAICKSLIEGKRKLTDPEFRFLRHELGISQARRISEQAALEDIGSTRMLLEETDDGWGRAA